MVRVALVGRRDDLIQLCFDLEGRLAGGHPGAVTDPEDMGVDRDGRLPERDVEHHIGGLAADARQFFQGLA